jgi:hypothetical protein
MSLIVAIDVAFAVAGIAMLFFLNGPLWLGLLVLLLAAAYFPYFRPKLLRRGNAPVKTEASSE